MKLGIFYGNSSRMLWWRSSPTMTATSRLISALFKWHGFWTCTVIDQSTALQFMDFPTDCHAHARVCSIFDHFLHFTLFFNMIQKGVVNFAYLLRTGNDLIVDKCRQIASFCNMKVSYLKCLFMSENKQLQNINTKSKWRCVVPCILLW